MNLPWKTQNFSLLWVFCFVLFIFFLGDTVPPFSAVGLMPFIIVLKKGNLSIEFRQYASTIACSLRSCHDDDVTEADNILQHDQS